MFSRLFTRLLSSLLVGSLTRLLTCLSCPSRNLSRQKGFTLLEVMVALAILSVASAGLITAAGGYLKQSQKVEDKVIAAWVADNWLNELRLAETAPESEQIKAEASMAGREWALTAQVIDTASEHLKRLEIEVRRADEDDKTAALAQLTAFLRSQR